MLVWFSMPFQKGHVKTGGRPRTKPPREVVKVQAAARRTLAEERGDWIAKLFDELDFNPLKLMIERAKALYYGGAEPEVLLPWLKELACYQAAKKQPEQVQQRGGSVFQLIVRPIGPTYEPAGKTIEGIAVRLAD